MVGSMQLLNLPLFILFSAFSLYSQSENTRFEKLTVEDGLSDNRVLSIYQDSKGFMWFGTLNGLNRYDGYTFKTYKHDLADSLSISEGWVSSLFEDHTGHLWIGTWKGGLCRYDRERNIFIRYQHDKDDPKSLSSNGILTIFESDKHILWIGCDKGLNSYSQDTDSFTRYYPDEKNPQFEANSNFIADITQDTYGKLWIGTWNQGLFYYDEEKDSFNKYIPNPDYAGLFINQFTNSLLAAQHNNLNYLWIGNSQNGLYKINLESGVIKHYKHDPKHENSISNNRIRTLYQSGKENMDLWVGTEDGGLNKFDINTDRVTHYRYNPDNVQSLGSDAVWSVFKDKSGLIWVGTARGVAILNPHASKFKTINLGSAKNQGLSGEVVWSIQQTEIKKDHSILWIGTEAGLHMYEQNSKHFRKYQHNPGNKNSLSHNTILALAETKSENGRILWAGSENGLNKIDPGRKTVTRYYISVNDPAYNQIFALCPDKSGVIWIGTHTPYLIYFDPISEQFKKQGSHYGIIRSLHLSRSGILWIGTQGNGLFEFNPLTKEEKHYKNIPGNLKSISDNWVRSITEDKNGSIWLGTGNGFNMFNRSNGTFSRFTKSDGLISNLVRSVLADGQGNLWLATDKGLSKFNPESETFRNFTGHDGLHDNEFWWASFINKKGEMFFGGKDGLTYFHPDSIKDNTFISPVYLTDFQIFNKSIKIAKDSPLKYDISSVKEIVLTHDQSVFSFEFAALEYRYPQKIKYAYKMENVDPDWVITDASRRFVTYTHLDPGVYDFRVKAASKDGVWNPKAAAVKITILPPWWDNWWAYSLYIVSIMALFYYIRRYELNRLNLKHEAAKWQELDSLKSKFFANISHEFRTPLTLILGPIQKVNERIRDPEDKKQFNLIQRNALRLQRLINQLLDLSRLEAGKLTLNAQKTDIIKFTRNITAAFESHAEQRNIQLHFKTDLKAQDIFLDVDKYEKIISNLLSNAFKFSEDGTTIEICIDKSDDCESNYTEGCCIIKISDQGMGIAPENISRVFDRFYQIDSDTGRGYEGSGIGLALVKELVELHHGKISLESRLAKGSVLSVHLPLGRKHLADDEFVEIPAADIQIKNYALPSETLHEQLTDMDSETELPLLLVVEDNRDVQSYLAGVLEKEYNLVFAINGNEGIEQAIQHIPDLIVSDVMMPGMDGFEMCSTIKNDMRTSHIPVILLTARAGQENKLEGLGTGADDYLTKPFDARELKIRIHNLIEQRRKLQEKINRLKTLSLGNLDIGNNDRSFLNKAIEITKKNMTDSSFNTDLFAADMALSRSQLFRKLKSLTGKSISEFIRFVRLQYAADLLKRKQGNVSEVAFEAGFNHLGNFSEHFKNQFGITPSEYVKNTQKSNYQNDK
jgi:signal transduction histidine kinase/ligand-binding sensor domain-containing protein/DNA-binding response OmpR family regulator